MLIHLALLGHLSLPTPWRHVPRPSDPRHFGGWTLVVRTDAFSTGHVCRLTRPGAEYQRQAVVLHLSPKVDTSQGVYRIDTAPPRSVGDDQATLAGLGFELHNDDLANPSGGLVRIPVGRLLNASAVRVETVAFTASTKFNLGGLRAALDAAKAAGCQDADFQ